MKKKTSKNLLNEHSIRRFMKLASIAPLSETFIDRQKEDDAQDERLIPPEPLEEQPEEEEIPGLEGDVPPEGELPPEELGAPEPAEAEGNEELLARVVQKVADELGVEVSVEGGEEVAPPAELGAEVPGEEVPAEALPGEEDEELPPPARRYEEAANPIDQSLEKADVNYFDDDAFAERLTQRVAERLVRESKKQSEEAKLEALAERIAAKLRSSK